MIQDIYLYSRKSKCIEHGTWRRAETDEVCMKIVSP